MFFNCFMTLNKNVHQNKNVVWKKFSLKKLKINQGHFWKMWKEKVIKNRPSWEMLESLGNTIVKKINKAYDPFGNICLSTSSWDRSLPHM